MMVRRQNRAQLYNRIIEEVFTRNFESGAVEVRFRREEMREVVRERGLSTPGNYGDVIYSFKFRADLPESVNARAPEGKKWMLTNVGRSKYAFVPRSLVHVFPDEALGTTKIPDATPGIVKQHRLNDEQALLAVLRYNRLLDVFCGTACYSLQSHLRTTVPGIGQIETDELYVGVDRRGAQYAIPVQAKGGPDRLAVVQTEQDAAMCRHKFPDLICRTIAAQFMTDDVVAVIELGWDEGETRKLAEKHYRLVPPEELRPEDLREYAARPLTD